MLGSRDSSSRGGEMGQRGRRRRPGAHTHARYLFSIVHNNFNGDYRPWAITFRVIGPRFFLFPRIVPGGEQVADFSELHKSVGHLVCIIL